MGLFDFFKSKGGSSSAPASGKRNEYDATDLFVACCDRDFDRVKKLLSDGADPNERSFVNYPDEKLFQFIERFRELVGKGHDPQHVADYELYGPNEPVEAMSLMIQQLNARQRNPFQYHHMELGFTTLHYPIYHSDNDIIFALLDAGADPNAEMFNGLFPLYAAAETGNLIAVKKLVSKGAIIDKETPKGNTALRNAVEEGHRDVVEYLLEVGADANHKNKAGDSILDAAEQYGRKSIVDLLLRHGADFSLSDIGISFASDDDVADLIAGIAQASQSLRGDVDRAGLTRYSASLRLDVGDLKNCLNEECVDVCYGSYGSDFEERLENAPGILKASMSDDTYSMFDAFKAATVDPSIDEIYLQIIKNYCLVNAIVEKDETLLREALSAGANPNQRCRYRVTRHTPIVAAALSNDADICRILLEAGADANKAQANSETALSMAAQNGNIEIIQLLLEAGADPNTVTHAGTALALADSTAAIFTMYANGADPNIPDRDGDLPIIGFIDTRRYEAVYALMICGTDMNHANNKGETPIDRAIRRGNERMIDIVSGRTAICSSSPSINIDPVRDTIKKRIQSLLALSYGPDCFFSAWSGDFEKLPSEKKLAFDQQAELASKATDLKRMGNLETANQLLVQAASVEGIFADEVVWGWFKVLLLAKNFRDAQLILRYYHAISASRNFIARNNGEIDFNNTPVSDSFLTLEFDAYNVFADGTRTWPLDKASVEAKIAAFGGDERWSTYSLSENEFDTFVRYFGYAELYNEIDS